MSKSKVIEQARAELGNTEWPPGSNKNKYGEAYGMNGVPYCAQFLWWVFNQAGERMAFFGGGKTASCGTLLRWYREQGLTVSTSEIQTGDIVILNFSGTKDTQHCGLVTDEIGNGWWHVIEGNTSPGLEGSQDSGGCVALKSRHIRQIVGVCRPTYKEEKVEPDYKGHWAENDIEWAKNIGIVKGYDDGSFKPNNNVTRAELVAILHRYDNYRFGGTGR